MVDEAITTARKEDSEMSKQVFIYQFRKGQRLHLDDIYHIQGMGSGWWEKTGDDLPEYDKDEIDLSESIVITRDVKITITVE